MIHVDEVVVVEGKYDKIRLSQLIDGLILETNGFGIFKDKGRMALLRRLAEARGLLVLTDSDSAGFLIRHYLSGSIPPEKIRHVYIPDIFGRERRKRKPSKEGKLGVEGLPDAVLLEALNRAGVAARPAGPPAGRRITKGDLYLLGLSGGENSAEKRRRLLRRLGLPEHLSSSSLPEVLNSLMTYDEFATLAGEL